MVLPDLKEVSAELCHEKVRIRWTGFVLLKSMRAAYFPLLRTIYVHKAYRTLSRDALRCLVAHELGHAHDKSLHRVWVGYMVSGLLVAAILPICHSGNPLAGWPCVAAFVSLIGFTVLLFSKKPFDWERRADEYAIEKVGSQLYWETKEEIRKPK
ncbi:M48 family metalloprotease [Acidithiobacillus ferrooxidans]|nr:M48 family metalloprotease [Acidithiobacillus ferrooxidans]